jgi:hypothetical protein
MECSLIARCIPRAVALKTCLPQSSNAVQRSATVSLLRQSKFVTLFILTNLALLTLSIRLLLANLTKHHPCFCLRVLPVSLVPVVGLSVAPLT